MHDSLNNSTSSMFLNNKGGKKASLLCTPTKAFINLITSWESLFYNNITDLLCTHDLKN